jgi:hypothetical protein
MLLMSENPESDVEGCASICAPCKGMGTKEEENGVAPAENGTLGLFVVLMVELSPKLVMNDPAKNRLFSDEFVVMENTSDAAPDSPPKGGADHEFEFVSQTATACPGDEKLPPTQIFLLDSSQKIALTSPDGPPLPRALNFDDANEAILLADVPLMDENNPAKYAVSPSAHPAFIFPPASVDPRRVREPSEARVKRVDVVGSNEREDELNRSRPANAPASPTRPIRSKSTLGRAADAKSGWSRRREMIRSVEHVRHDVDVNVMVVRGRETYERGEKKVDVPAGSLKRVR